MENSDSKQRLLLEYLISSVDTFARCKSIINPDYFNPEFRRVVKFINTYYDKYSATPDPDQIDAETSVELHKRIVTKDQIQYCSDEIEAFCKQRALESAVVQASAMLQGGDPGKIESLIKEAIAVSLDKDLGVQYFEDPLARLEEQLNTTERIPTNWTEFDEALAGGLARKEILLLSANSGGGKSITLANLAINMLSQNLNVLYLTLELSEEMVSQRFDTMFTGVSSVAWKNHYHSMADKIELEARKHGKLTIKRLPTGANANDIRAYLKEFELKQGYIPDVLIVDYLDIMGTNERSSNLSISEKDKATTEQLREVIFDYNMMCATASQQNRSAIDATELNQSHIAGGLTKVNTVDWYISIIFTPTMKAAGDIGFSVLKARSSNAVGTSFFLRWDNKYLRILNPSGENKKDPIIDKLMEPKPSKEGKRSLMDIMDI